VEAQGKIIDADDPPGAIAQSRYVTFHANIQRVSWGNREKRGQTMATYRRPHFQGSIENPPRDADGKIPAENLSDLLGQISENSMGEIDNLVDEFQRLREKLRTDGERIQREIDEYKTLSQQVMELTKTISGSVEKVRASVDQ
jgi:hypothetical protein